MNQGLHDVFCVLPIEMNPASTDDLIALCNEYAKPEYRRWKRGDIRTKIKLYFKFSIRNGNDRSVAAFFVVVNDAPNGFVR